MCGDENTESTTHDLCTTTIVNNDLTNNMGCGFTTINSNYNNIGTSLVTSNSTMHHNGGYANSMNSHGWTLASNGMTYQNSTTIGDSDNKKCKIYIVDKWQSKRPIHIKDDLWISFGDDLIPYEELKKDIVEKICETHPELVVKIGFNTDEIKLVKREVTLEINFT